MLGIASRYFAGRIAVAAAAAIILGIVTGLDETGHVVMFGTIVLGTAAAAFALLTALALSLGDNDSIDRERSHSYPATPAYWPVMSAFGLGLLMVGLTTDGFIAILGLATIITASVEWTVSAWADRLSKDQVANATERDRLIAPFEIPLYGALSLAIPVLLISRVFLAASRNNASWIALGLSSVVLAFAFVLYAKPEIRRAIVATALVAAGAGLIVAGITSAAIGERDFHPHEVHQDEDIEHENDSEATDYEEHSQALNPARIVVR